MIYSLCSLLSMIESLVRVRNLPDGGLIFPCHKKAHSVRCHVYTARCRNMIEQHVGQSIIFDRIENN